MVQVVGIVPPGISVHESCQPQDSFVVVFYADHLVQLCVAYRLTVFRRVIIMCDDLTNCNS